MNLSGDAGRHLPWVERLRRGLSADSVRYLALVLLCGAYLQGGLFKAADFGQAIAEMERFGLRPPAVMAVLVIAVELGGSALILTGRLRWLGALALGGFTFLATLMAYRFWDAAAGDRLAVMNGFFEHLGLIGGLLLVAWHDLRTSQAIHTDSGRRP